jgi:hypothetical protein
VLNVDIEKSTEPTNKYSQHTLILKMHLPSSGIMREEGEGIRYYSKRKTGKTEECFLDLKNPENSWSV